MAYLLRQLATSYAYAMRELSDQRLKNYLLVDSPIPTIFILTCYLLFIFDIGPKYMKSRKAFNIDRILIVYNAIQMVVCLYLGIYLFPHTFNTDDITCYEIDYSPETKPLAILLYVYFVTKILDLLDTVFFVLRKKNNQISFLHVYHHTIMVAYVWFGLKYIAGGQLIFIAMINSFVHVVMYFYYLLTAYDAEYKRSAWWKKHITQMQLLQFAAITGWVLMPVMQPSCKFPKMVTLIVFPQVFAITALFADFYYKTYIKKKPVIMEIGAKMDDNHNVVDSNSTNSNK